MTERAASQVTIVRAVQTCSICPSAWDAWDADGCYWSLYYRWGTGTAERQPSPDPDTWTPPLEAGISFSTGDPLDGTMELDEFCRRAGLALHLEET
jgi:hypothetical protein